MIDFLQTSFQTEMGQLVDLITAPEEHVDLNKFSLEKYERLLIFLLPLQLTSM